MPIWRNCNADIYYSDDEAELRDPGYEVRIDDGEIAVSYQGDDDWIVYAGSDMGGGHYVLTGTNTKGREIGQAMLHRAPNSEILNGYWNEDNYVGMWRIRLIE